MIYKNCMVFVDLCICFSKLALGIERKLWKFQWQSNENGKQISKIVSLLIEVNLYYGQLYLKELASSSIEGNASQFLESIKTNLIIEKKLFDENKFDRIKKKSSD